MEEERAEGAGGEPRVVALSPAVAIILRDLGYEDVIVGRHGYDLVLDESLPVCGDQAGIDYEALLRARPTHVFLEWGSRDLPPRLDRMRERHGWEVESYRLLTLDDVDETAHDLHERLSEAGDGRDGGAADALLRWESAVEPTPGRFEDAGRVLLLMSTNPPSVLGPGSAHHELLERVGGVPAVEEGSPHVELDAEDVVRLAPDAIVLLRPATGGAAHAGIVRWPESRRELGVLAGLGIPAVEEGRVAVLDHPLGLMPSTSLAEVGEALERVLREWSEGG